VRPDTPERIADAKRAWQRQQAMFELERDTVRKMAWRELRARVRTGWSRRYLLLTTELSFDGAIGDAVGVESFMLQTVQRSGRKMTITPRLAAESEVWPTRMKARAGLYLEPTRFAQSSPRLHGTFGIDVRVLHWDVFGIWPEDYLWQLSIAGDFTRQYVAVSVSVGGWY
jgi:hypothetical protein